MSDTKYWLALNMIKGIGTGNLRLIYDGLSQSRLSARDLFDLEEEEIVEEFHLSEKIAKAVLEAKKNLSRVEDELGLLEGSGVEIIIFFEKRYPQSLSNMLKNTMPPVLFVLGNSALLHEQGAAVLGDINVSEKGSLVTSRAAKELVSHRIVVISGLAQGADLIAHVSALQHGGSTIAVLPFGMRHFKMPKVIEAFFDEKRMLFVSTFYPDREYSIYNSYERNRIIVALSRAVFIVEAPSEGGIFEAGKSAKTLDVPLFVAEYASYPKSASGNEKLIAELKGIPVRGRKEGEVVIPNLDKLIAKVKFGE